MVPPLSTLLSDATWKALRDFCPVSRALLFYCFSQDLIFLLCPGSHRNVAFVIKLKPAFVALDLRFSSYFAYAIPCVSSVFLNGFAEFVVLVVQRESQLKRVCAIRLTSSCVHCIFFLMYFVPG